MTKPARTIHRGDHVTYCSVDYLVGSVDGDEALLHTMSGVVLDWVPLEALHQVARAKSSKGQRPRKYFNQLASPRSDSQSAIDADLKDS